MLRRFLILATSVAAALSIVPCAFAWPWHYGTRDGGHPYLN